MVSWHQPFAFHPGRTNRDPWRLTPCWAAGAMNRTLGVQRWCRIAPGFFLENQPKRSASTTNNLLFQRMALAHAVRLDFAYLKIWNNSHEILENTINWIVWILDHFNGKRTKNGAFSAWTLSIQPQPCSVAAGQHIHHFLRQGRGEHNHQPLWEASEDRPRSS